MVWRRLCENASKKGEVKQGVVMSKPKAFLCLLVALAFVAFGVTQSAFAKPATSRSVSVNRSSSSQTFVSFSQFLTNVAHARSTDYASLATTRVQNQQAFAAVQAN